MPDFQTGLIPQETVPQFLPDNTQPARPLPTPVVAPQFNTTKDNSSFDFITPQLSKMKANSFSKQTAPEKFSTHALGAEMYKNADQFRTYGLSLTGNNEETYGQLQTGWDRTKRALGGAWALTKNQFAEQLTSWGDTLSFLHDNKSAFEQDEMNEINRLQNETEAKNHIFHTADDDATIFNWANVASTVQQSGYALGAIAEIVAEEAAMTAITAATLGGTSELQGARTAQQAVTVAKMFRKVKQVAEVTEEASRLRKAFNVIQKANPFLDNSINFAFNAKNLMRASEVAGEVNPLLRTVGKGFGAFYRDVREVNAALSEAKAEAAGANQDITDRLLKDYNDKWGKDPDALTMQNIQKTALEGAQTDGIWNTYLIMVTNKIGMDNVMSGIKPLRALESTVGEGILKLSDKEALKAGGGKEMKKLVSASENKWLAFKQGIVRRPLSYMKTNIDEALQENLQDVIKDTTVNYYSAKYAHNNDPNSPMKSMYDYMMKAGKAQFSVQGAKTFLSGFMTGALISPVNNVFGHSGNIKQFITDREGYKARQSTIKKNRNEAIDSFNDIYNNPLTFGYKMGDATLQANFAEVLKAAAKTNDKKTFNDIKDDALRHFIMTGIKTGALESMVDRLKTLPQKLSKEEFATAFGMDATEENRKLLQSQIDHFANRADEIKDIHENVRDKFENPFNAFHERFKGVDKTKDPEYIREALGHMAWNDAVNNLVFMKDYYNQAGRRSVAMLDGLRKKPGFENVSFNDVHLLTSTDHIAAEIDMLDTEIKGLQPVAGAPADAGAKKLRHEKQERLKLLEKYHEHLSEWQDSFFDNSALPVGSDREAAMQKSFDKFQKKAAPLFGEFVNNGLRSQQKSLVTNDNVENAFVNLHDYMKVQQESGIVLDKINLLADAKNFKKFFEDHDAETRYYYHAAKLQAEKAAAATGPVATAPVVSSTVTPPVATAATVSPVTSPVITTTPVTGMDKDIETVHENWKYDIDEIDAQIAALDPASATYAVQKDNLEKEKESRNDYYKNYLVELEKKKNTPVTAPAAVVAPTPVPGKVDPQAEKIKKYVEEIKTADKGRLAEIQSELLAEKLLSNPEIQEVFATRRKEILEEENKKLEPIDEEKVYAELEIAEKERLIEELTGDEGKKPDTAFATTGKETVDSNSSEIDQDPVKRVYYDTIRKLKILAAEKKVSFADMEIAPGRRGIYLTAMNPSKMFTESVDGNTRLNALGQNSLEQNTVQWAAKSISEFMQSTILVITDENGQPYHFNDVGEYHPNGIVLTTNMRKPYVKNGEYFLTNTKGDQLQAPAEIAAKILKAGGLAVEGDPLLEYEALIKLIEQSQQTEFETLYKIRESLKNDTQKKHIFPIKSITNGVIDIDYKNPAKLSDFKLEKFEPRVIVDPRLKKQGLDIGGVYFQLPGYTNDILIVRPAITEQQAETVLQLLFNPKQNLLATEIHEFLKSIVYTKPNDIEFWINDGKVVAKYWDGEKMDYLTEDLVSNPQIRTAFKNKLLKKKLNIVKESIGTEYDYITYDAATDSFKTEKIPYNDFIKNNFETFVQPNDEGTVTPLNAYIKFNPMNIDLGDTSTAPVNVLSPLPIAQPDIVTPESDELDSEEYIKAINGASTFAELQKTLKTLPVAFRNKWAKYIQIKTNWMREHEFNTNHQDYQKLKAGNQVYYWKLDNGKIIAYTKGGKLLSIKSSNYNTVVDKIFSVTDILDHISAKEKEGLATAAYAYFNANADLPSQLQEHDVQINEALGNVSLKWNKFAKAELLSKTGKKSFKTVFITEDSKRIPGKKYMTVEDVAGDTGFSTSDVVDFISRFPRGIDNRPTMQEDALEYLKSEFYGLFGVEPSVPLVMKVLEKIQPSEQKVDDYVNLENHFEDMFGEALISLMSSGDVTTDGETDWAKVHALLEQDATAKEYLESNGLYDQFLEMVINNKNRANEKNSTSSQNQESAYTHDDSISNEAAQNTGAVEKTTEEKIIDNLDFLSSLDKAKGISNVATPEQIFAAEKWWNESPLSKHISLERMMNVVNSTAIANWTEKGITLFQGANSTDIYHEAFHGFSQLFLTKDQKLSLYDEVRKLYPDLNNLQAEELLAEDFRKYVLSDGKKILDQRPVSNTIWRKILNFLRSLFTGVKQSDMALQSEAFKAIQDVYDKLYTGKINDYSPSVYNILFTKLNKGIEFKDGTILSNSESLLINQSIDSIIVQTIQSVNNIAEAKGLPTKNVLSLIENPAFRNGIYNAVKLKFQTKLEKGDEYQQVLAKKVLSDFESVIKYHISKSKYLKSAGVVAQFDEDGNLKDIVQEGDDSNSDKLTNKDAAFSQAGNDKSIAENASPEVIQLLSGLFERDLKGNFILNELGENKLIPFAKVNNRIIKKLNGILDENQMYTTLLQSSQEYPEMGQLAMELGDPSDYENNPLKFNLWMKMRQSYSMTRIPIHQMLIEKDVNGKLITRLIESRPDIQGVLSQFTAEFQSRLNDPYIFVNEDGNNVLNVQKVLGAFASQTIDKNGDVLIALHPGKELEFLKAVGFNFSDKAQIKKGVAANTKINYIAQKLYSIDEAGIPVTDPLEQIMSDTYRENYEPAAKKKLFVSKGENNNVKSLLELEVTNSDDFSNYSVVNPQGDKEWEHSLNNNITLINNLVNDSKKYPTYQSLIQEPEMYKFDITRNPMADGFWLNSIFDLKTGERRINPDGSFVTVNLVNLSGVKEISDNGSADTGVKTNGLDLDGKHLFDYNSLLSNGVEELPRAEAKSTYFGVSVSTLNNGPKNSFSHLYFPMKNFTTRGILSNSVSQYMKKCLVGELTRIGWLNQGIGGDIAGYNERAKFLVLFDDILKADTKVKLLKLLKDGTPENLTETIENMSESLHGEFKHYFDALEVENWAKVKNNLDSVNQEVFKKLSDYMYSISNGKDKSSDNDKHRMLNKAYTVNSWVAKMESMKWIYGDPAFYNLEKEEFNKRIPAFNATKTTLSLSKGSMDFVNNRLGRLVAKAMGLNKKQFDGTLGVRIYKDVSISSSYIAAMRESFKADYKSRFPEKSDTDIAKLADIMMDPYDSMKESDAQGYITLDAWRIMKNLQGQWNDQMEKLYMKEVNGEPLTAAEREIFFSVQKAQYAGPVKTDKLFVPAFHKFSLMPLIPSMIKGTNMEVVNKDLIKNNIDYATFESGSKIATVGATKPFYSDQEKRTVNTDDAFVTNTVFARYFGEQLKIDSKWKEEVIFSTQLRKLVDSGLFENGKPIDFDGTREEWSALSSREKERLSEFYNRSNEFVKQIGQLSNLKKEKLIRDAKLEMKDGHYVINDYGPLVQLIKKEFEKREMPDNVIDFIDLTKDNKIKTSLDLSTQTQKIEGVIQSIINNRLIRQTVNGEPLIQLASTGFEKFRNPTEAETKLYTNDLPFYKEKGRTLSNGKSVTSAMKIKIALTGDYLKLLKLTHIDGNTIDVYDEEQSRQRLNECLRNEHWLDQGDNRRLVTLTGVRIPVQGLNSMEFMEVYEFLPSKAGNVIIPASEIVAKAGSDFDVDKLSVFKANIADDGSFISNQYTSYDQVTKLLDNVITEKRALMSKTRLFTNALRQEVKDIKKIKDSEYREYVKAREYAKIERDIYLEEIRDILDSLDYRDDVKSYQNKFNTRENSSNLIDALFSMNKDMDLQELDKNLYQYYNELQKIDQTYNDVNRIINDYEFIKRLTHENIHEVKGEELGQLMDYSDRIRGLFEARRNLIKSTENKLMYSIREILEMNHNFLDLVTPNSTKDVEGLADKLRSRNINYDSSVSKVTGEKTTSTNKKGKTAPYISGTRLLEPAYNESHFLANNSGKDGLGIGAIDNTFNNLFNKVGAYMNAAYNRNDKRVDFEILLPHNKIQVGDKKFISLSHLYDANGVNKLGDILSQLLNGWVDVGKKAWIFNINGGVENTPVILLLNQIGTPISDIAHFMTQPVIQRYSKALRSKNNLFAKVVNPENYKYFEGTQRTKILAPLMGLDPNKLYRFETAKSHVDRKLRYTDLVKMIQEKHLLARANKVVFTSEKLETEVTDNYEQAALLYQYFQLEDVGKQLKDIKTSLNFDTNKATNSIAAQDKKNQFDDVMQAGLLPQSQLLALKNESVLSSFAIQDFNIDFQEQLLPLRNNKLMNDFILRHKDDLPLESRTKNFEKFAKTFKNDYIEYLFQQHVTNTRDINPWFRGIDSIADQLYKVKKENPELVKQYPLLDKLIKNKSKRELDANKSLNNIKLSDASLDTDVINAYHEQFTKLVDPDIRKSDDPEKNKELTKFFNQLAVFGFLQSGLNKSPISWTEIIPQELYTRLMEPVITSVTKSMDEKALNEFYILFRNQNTVTFGFTTQSSFGETIPLPVSNKEPYRFKNFKNIVTNPGKKVTTVTQSSTDNLPPELGFKKGTC